MLARVDTFLLHLLLFVVIKLVEVTLVDTGPTVIFESTQNYSHSCQDLFCQLSKCEEFSLSCSETVEEEFHLAERDVLNPLRTSCQRR